MRVGLHVDVRRGLEPALDYAERLGCTALQIFSSNSRTYRVQAVDRVAFGRFRERCVAAGIAPVVIHTSYLINLARDDPSIVGKSLKLLEADLVAAAAGGIAYVNTHLGSYGTRPREQGFAQVVAALERALSVIPPDVQLVLENSAGAGSLCGGTVEG